jgi:Tol biopolymer transport system component
MTAPRMLIALVLTGLAVSVPLAGANHGAPQLVTPGTTQAIFTASITRDGSRVYFATSQSLSAADGDSAVDVYQRVLSTGVTTLVSDRVLAGADQEVDASFAGASADGSRVFILTAEQYLDADDDSATDVYELFGGTTTLVTDRIQAGADAELGVLGAGASGSATNYFFLTTEPLVAADGDGSQDLYVRSGGTTRLVSDRVQDNADAALAASVGGGAQSDDGSRILFTTQEQIVDADDDANTDLYLYDVPSATTTLVSDRVQDAADAARNIDFISGMTRSGSHIFFQTDEPILAQDTDAGLCSGGADCDDVYRYTVADGTTTMISDNPVAGADEGEHAAMTAGVQRPASDDGSKVLFVTGETLAPEDGDGALACPFGSTGCIDVYKWSNGTTELVSDRPAGADEALHAFPHGLSPDGARVIFVTFESMLPAEDTDSAQDVYLREGGVTTLLSDRIQPGPDAGTNISTALANKDVTRVFFRPTEPLLAADTDSSQDIYERAGGVTTLLSDRQKAGPDEEKTINAQAHSEDGSQVIFTIEEQLVIEDTDAVYDVYWSSGGPLPAESTPGDAIDDAATVAEDAAATTIDVRANDTDPDATKELVTAKTEGAHGAVAITNAGADVSYKPAADYCGADSFTYTLAGGGTATVSMTVTCVDDPITPPVVPGTTPPGPLSACTPSTGFKSVSVKPARRGLRFKLALSKNRRFTAEVFQRSRGRDIKTRRVARIVRKAGKARHAFRWNGRSATSDGFYVVRLAMALPGRPDVRQLVFQRRRGKFAARPVHTLRDTCSVLRSFRLSSPVFGGKNARALQISYVLGGASDVEISVRRGREVVLTVAEARRPGGVNLKTPLLPVGMKRGEYKVTIRITRGGLITTGTITARLL